MSQSLAQWFGWRVDPKSTEELPDIFPFPFRQADFVSIDVVNIFAKILTDVVERTHGLTDEQYFLLWDNCLKSSTNEGLITMIAKAMSDKKDLFVVYEKDVEVIREATGQEAAQIRADYEKAAESPLGIFMSFKNFRRADMIKMYSALEFATVGSLYKNMNLAKAIQIKMSDLRASTGLTDSAGALDQAKIIAKGLGDGKDVLLDSKDEIVTATPDLTSTKESITFLDSKRAFYLGFPLAYINGEQTGGLGSTGENDSKAIERGLKSYYYSIIKPVCEEIFGVKLKYKSQDFRQLDQALEAIKTFELVSDELVTFENKKRIIEAMLDLDSEENGDDTREAPPKAAPALAIPAPPVPAKGAE